MRRSEGTFTSFDGLTIFHQAWQPDDDARAVVLLLHGLGEHSGRYEHLASALTGAGDAVYALDHRGHGKSEGKRTYVKSYDEFQRDILQFRQLVEQQHPDTALVVFGHSMGGNLALGHVLDHQDGVRALALSAPALAIGSSLSPTKIKLLMTIAKIAPGLRPEALDAEAISRDPAVVAAYRADPLVYNGRITAGVGAALIGSMQRMPARYAELRLPLLLQHGTDDQLADISGTRALAAGAVNAEVTTHYYEGLYHEIYNEPEQAAVIADLTEWLDAVTPG